jgi:hypothetical protein
MIFSKRRVKPKLILNFGTTSLKEAGSHIHLGLTFDDRMSWHLHVDNICKKTSSRIFGLRLIKNLVPRKTLINLYKSIIRPLVEYSCAVFDNISIVDSLRLEKLQRTAAIICTGAYSLTSTDLLLKDLGWDRLSIRRKYYRMTLMYKITHDLVPNYLKRLLPPTNQNRTRYSLRNVQNYTLIRSNTSYHAKSFLPATIRDWNLLPLDIRNSNSITIFKSSYKRNYFIQPNNLYNDGFGIGVINQTRLRLGLSALRAHLFKFNIVDSPMCQFCNISDETIIHFTFHCPTFSSPRALLLMRITETIPFELLVISTERDLVKFLLYGNNTMSDESNRTLFEIYQDYIINSKRFNYI